LEFSFIDVSAVRAFGPRNPAKREKLPGFTQVARRYLGDRDVDSIVWAGPKDGVSGGDFQRVRCLFPEARSYPDEAAAVPILTGGDRRIDVPN
jgi:hypothetical protein